MNLNKIIISVLILLPLTSLCADEQRSYLIRVPDYISREDFVPEDESLIVKTLQNEIYEIFYHYASGNAVIDTNSSNGSEENVFSVNTDLRLNKMMESVKGGFFCETELAVSLFPSVEKNDKSIIVKYTGYGKNKSEAFIKSVSKLPELFRYKYSDIDEKAGFYRILDIYQNEIIVSCGRNEGFHKGDYLEILNSQSGKTEGRIILTAVENEIAYGRLLNWSDAEKSDNLPDSDIHSTPAVGSRIKKINYWGFETSVCPLFLLDDIFSGNSYNIKLEYFRGLYVFHPFITAGLLNLESENNSYDLALYSGGIMMLRHFGRLSLKSEASLAGGWYRSGSSALDFKGGAVKGGISYYIARHLSVSAEAGFIELFAEDSADPNIGGFLFGCGLSFKY